MKKQHHFTFFAICLFMIASLTSCKDDVSTQYVDTESGTSPNTPGSTDSTEIVTPPDTASDTGNVVAKDTDPVDSATSSQQDTNTIEDTSKVVDSASETETTQTDTASDSATAVATDTDSATDTTPEGLFIQAECAIDNQLADCAGNSVTGSYSALPDDLGWGHNPENDPKTYPTLASDGQVGYTNGGSWFAFEGIDLTGYTQLTMHYASQEDADATIITGFRLRLDAADGAEIGFVETHFTESWTTYTEQTVALSANVSGTHTVYFVAETAEINNGNVDWIHFHN